MSQRDYRIGVVFKFTGGFLLSAIRHCSPTAIPNGSKRRAF